MATRSAIAATVFIAAAMTASVWLITDVLFGEPTTVIVASVVAGTFVAFWYAFPLYRRLKEGAGDKDPSG
jgi:hypothetical protein